MKRRNQLLALFCLLAFAGLGILYFEHWVVQKPFGIVLFVGEGLVPGRIAATRVFAGGADTALAMDALPHTALVTNHSNDFATPDSAAAATALASGVKTKNRSIGRDSDNKSVPNILELARAAGRATGLVTDGRLVDPTTAAFFAHNSEANDQEAIAREFVERAHIDVVLGGGASAFVAQDKGGQRSDGRDLLLELRRAGAQLVRTKAELENVPAWRRPKVLGALAAAELAYSDQLEARATQPSLADMVRRAIELLQYNRSGYILVVDAALMRKAAQENNGERVLSETVELDRAIGVAEKYVGEGSMVVVCGDVGIGGLTMNGFPFRKDRGIAVLGLSSAGDPWLTWSTGPNGTASYGASKLLEFGTPRPTSTEGSVVHPPEEPAAVYAKTALNTVDDVVALGSGPGTEAIHGTIENTFIFRLLRGNL